MIKLRYRAVAACALALLLAPASMAAPTREGAPSVLPAQFVNSVAFVQGRIGDSAPAWFLLDIGASLSALDEKVAKSLALKPAGGTSVQGSAGTIEAGDETYVNVTEGVYGQLKKADPSLVPAKYFTASGAGGTIRIPVVPAHSLTLGVRTFDRPILIVQPRTGYFAEPDAVGFLGAYALKSGRGFIVDYPRKQLILLR